MPASPGAAQQLVVYEAAAGGGQGPADEAEGQVARGGQLQAAGQHVRAPACQLLKHARYVAVQHAQAYCHARAHAESMQAHQVAAALLELLPL